MNKFLPIFLFLLIAEVVSQHKPEDFVYLLDLEPSIKIELRYFSNNNFIGQPIDGYHRSTIIVS